MLFGEANHIFSLESRALGGSQGLRGACEDRSEALTVGTLLCYTTIVMGNKEKVLN